MLRFLRPSRPSANQGFAYRLGWLIGRAIVWFVAVSVGLTVIYRFVPVPVTLTMIMDPNGFDKEWTPLSRIDRNMVAAVIAGEDAKFCSHGGFDQQAIEQAIEKNAKGKRLRGGSTISQQTAKNVFLWQGTGWTRYARKGLEVWFTFLIETIWDKRRIMEVYLNVAETGIGTYGVEAGAQRYYKHSAARLTRVEAARIAAALPAPKRRAVAGATGFTRRHGNAIAARSGVVRNEALDACVYE
ncbi:MAG: monofunctional biosynthetic peptidoglycan transglycosylase [Pseudomonadota bacterium]|jgi:monofunctional biosynthetic peptidoglycan transglycosylase|nr:monofunctional biosynthetic peptidoglycan transglycosylase [Novosphingobium sp.]HOA48902.1 monofunctional biosynthetic peptidoglycan transglycosylase [Novosphingobium sp.]HPB22540.1 monofunctional biosynthetic peptidoglycan transglycosylase [Novosphingobium sp.]HPZ48064.1 monofunctional biosynthetic peptidoglycan transglycosylase [Novosphingobium sp.]HQE00654.1 monofunctional biosynthetic peptidoglycan transglycosylase [Novosphingobium sp.]